MKKEMTTNKQTIKESLSKAKEKMSNKIEKAKSDYKAYKQALKTSQRIGAKSGAEDYPKLPKVKGAVTEATIGYNKSLRTCKKADKLKREIQGV